MNNLAPRQGIFAIILLVSFCLHIVILMFSTEKQQYDYRTDKGEKIVEQLSKEAMVALANQDRISLSVLTNRYQVDSDVAKLVITDPNNQVLVQTGQSQTQTGQTIDQPIIQNNQLLGHAIVTMRAISKGEIIGNQWLYILGSAIVHGFLWLIYGYIARPTDKQLQEIGEKVQQRIALARYSAPTIDSSSTHQRESDSQLAVNEEHAETVNTNQRTIQDFLHATTNHAEDSPIQSNSNENTEAAQMLSTSPSATLPTAQPDTFAQQLLALQIRFFDEFGLMQRVAPELAKPYLQLCVELLSRACDSLFGANSALINRYVRDVTVQNTVKFTDHGAVVHLSGNPAQLPLAAVLLSKLVIILNQVVYEKHRELSRFALPMTAGVSLDSQFDDTQRLMTNHAKEDGLMLLLPKPMISTLNGQVQLKKLPQPTSVTEREMLIYSGLAESLMAELIHKRDEILTASASGF